MPDDNPSDGSPIADEVPAADREEQRSPATPPVDGVDSRDPVPEADALDQARPTRETASFEPPSIPDDVPEADALDQARTVLDDDDRHDVS